MIIKDIRHTAFALLAVAALACTGCHSDSPAAPAAEEPEQPAPDPDKLTLRLDVSFDVDGSKTRAEKDPDGYEPSKGSFEQISSLRVIIMREVEEDSNGNSTGIVEANRMVATYDNGNPRYDDLEFEVIADEKKRIYLVANERTITSVPAGQDFETVSKFLDSFAAPKEGEQPTRVNLTVLANWTVGIPEDVISGDVTTAGLYSDAETIAPRLPLTEFFDIYANSENAVDNICYSHLFLTRAAAKATLYIDQKNTSPGYENVTITSFSLSGIGSEQYVFPHGAEYSIPKYPSEGFLGTTGPSSGPTSDKLEMYIKDFTTPKDMPLLTYSIDKLNVPVIDGSSDLREVTGEFPIYFPESILAEGEQYEVSVTLSTGITLTAPLETNILRIGDSDAIARNTHLKIQLTFSQFTMDAQVVLAPYLGVSLNPWFGFD
ncbi:MAG: hypothetical protein HDR47_08490 [Bacteroides sp.]|nr:hypothetical protein [Bacteroides sp.]